MLETEMCLQYRLGEGSNRGGVLFKGTTFGDEDPKLSIVLN